MCDNPPYLCGQHSVPTGLISHSISIPALS